jgi:hypothetical protein
MIARAKKTLYEAISRLFLVAVSFQSSIYLLMAMYNSERRLDDHQLCIKPNIDRVINCQKCGQCSMARLFPRSKMTKYSICCM